MSKTRKIGKRSTKKERQYKKTKKRKQSTGRAVYSKKDYTSGDGMLTTIWGPSLWHFLHTMSFNYPNKPTAENKKIIEIIYYLSKIFYHATIVEQIW